VRIGDLWTYRRNRYCSCRRRDQYGLRQRVTLQIARKRHTHVLHIQRQALQHVPRLPCTGPTRHLERKENIHLKPHISLQPWARDRPTPIVRSNKNDPFLPLPAGPTAMPVIQRRRILGRDPDRDLELPRRRSLDLDDLRSGAEDMDSAVRLATPDMDPERFQRTGGGSVIVQRE
jgi:hypothetical protein